MVVTKNSWNREPMLYTYTSQDIWFVPHPALCSSKHVANNGDGNIRPVVHKNHRRTLHSTLKLKKTQNKTLENPKTMTYKST